MTSRMITPAVMVRPSDWKMAPMVFPSVLCGFEAKKV
jgi:hypothetical protein